MSKFVILAQKETRWVTVQMGGAQIGAAHNGPNQANLSIPTGQGKTNNDYPIKSTGNQVFGQRITLTTVIRRSVPRWTGKY